MMEKQQYDVIVIGAGHAGCEAALAAARMGRKVLVAAINVDKIAHMPCNPAIGGIGKGQLVREIDALGGEMGRVIDRSLVQIKILNSSKGPAVQAPRAQADKREYSRLMKTVLLGQEGLRLIQGEVVAIRQLGGGRLEAALSDGSQFSATAIVVATGTFMRGELVVGQKKVAGGRAGELASAGISIALESLGLRLGRFQSATPPRVLALSVDFSKMKVQPGDRTPINFSFSSPTRIKNRQRDCYLTYTSEKTHEVIKKHIHLSPIKSGSVSARGPRYCPSIDRKVINFPDRERHPVFVEPEGWKNHELYLQGLTTSMPVEIQEMIIQTVPGLSAAKVIRPGYAVAYDYLLPHQLKSSLESLSVAGLFTAGQINGTSGYEEAAAQGLIAGINAALHCRGETPLVLSRSEGYIGVLVDDLVTKEIDEPYRMFTSRAEHRLVLRADNADLRLAPIGHRLGLVSDKMMLQVSKKARDIARCLDKLEKRLIGPGASAGAPVAQKKGAAVKARDLLKRPEINIEQIKDVVKLGGISKDARHQAEIEVKYQGYIKRQLDQIEAQKRLELLGLPEIDFASIEALSTEARQKLARHKPASLGQAARIAGVSPADISVLMVYLEKCRTGS